MNRKRLGLAAALVFMLVPGAITLRSAGGHDGKADGGKTMAAMQGFHAHFCGIHVARDNPKIQLITQHYCGPRGQDMHQCLLFDSTAKNAKLIGVEYIISDKLFRQLPEEEKKYWHPHTYEVLAGGLIAPSMKHEDETAFMKAILTTWGKTIHTWPDPKTEVPMGEPMLMWSLTGDGQEDQAVLAARDRQFGVVAAKIRQQRGEAFGLEVPQVKFEMSGRQWTNEGADLPTKRK